MTWGKKIEGRTVRLRRKIETRGGSVFEAGTELVFSHRTMCGLVLLNAQGHRCLVCQPCDVDLVKEASA